MKLNRPNKPTYEKCPDCGDQREVGTYCNMPQGVKLHPKGHEVAAPGGGSEPCDGCSSCTPYHRSEKRPSPESLAWAMARTSVRGKVEDSYCFGTAQLAQALDIVAREAAHLRTALVNVGMHDDGDFFMPYYSIDKKGRIVTQFLSPKQYRDSMWRLRLKREYPKYVEKPWLKKKK